MPQLRALVIEPGYADHNLEREKLASIGATVEMLQWKGNPEALAQGLAAADLVFVRDVRLDAPTLASASRLKGIVRYGVGVDTVDLEQATRQHIVVANVPDYGADIDVADHTLALFLAVQRRVVTRDNDVRRGKWGVGQREPIDRIAGKVLGLIGFGRIARAVRRRFLAFGVEAVLVYDPYLSDRDALGADVRKVPLHTLAIEADIISIHAPSGSRDAPIIDADFISQMRRNAILINTARGSLVDEGALADALAAGVIFGAGLDVFRTEPPDLQCPILNLPNVVISDHTGWYSEAGVRELQRQAAEEAHRILSGHPPHSWVNRW